MSNHHHEGHGGRGSALRHDWFFYVSGFFLLLALIGFLLANTLSPRPTAPPPVPAPSAAGQ